MAEPLDLGCRAPHVLACGHVVCLVCASGAAPSLPASPGLVPPGFCDAVAVPGAVLCPVCLKPCLPPFLPCAALCQAIEALASRRTGSPAQPAAPPSPARALAARARARLHGEVDAVLRGLGQRVEDAVMALEERLEGCEASAAATRESGLALAQELVAALRAGRVAGHTLEGMRARAAELALRGGSLARPSGLLEEHRLRSRVPLDTTEAVALIGAMGSVGLPTTPR
eukprot:m51a1_g7096 hypothetical protein (228) ;mRNA; f:41641-42645